MGQVVAFVIGMVMQILPSFLGKALAALGIGVVTYSGFKVTLDWLKSQAVSSFSALPPEVIGMLGVLKVGECISIVCSAMIARLVMNGLQSDKVKRWVTK